MNKSRTFYTILITGLVIALVLCGAVIAYMFRQTEYENNEFTPAEVSCEVEEAFDGTQKTSVQIENTGNIDAYLRVRFVSYWVDSNGNVVPKASEMPDITMADGWLKGSNGTYYYTVPVAPDGLTDNLLAAPMILRQDDNGYLQVVEVFAEAIQSEPAKAVTGSWSVTVDDDGNITAVN